MVFAFPPDELVQNTGANQVGTHLQVVEVERVQKSTTPSHVLPFTSIFLHYILQVETVAHPPEQHSPPPS